MLAERVTPPTGSEAPADFPLDLRRMREITYRSSDQDEDPEMRDVLNEAITDIERTTGLKLRPGTFVARFVVRERWDSAHSYSSGQDPKALGRYEELALPGVNCELVKLESVIDGVRATLGHGDTRTDQCGNLWIDSPSDGWPESVYQTERGYIEATFTAGGTSAAPVLGAVQKAVGLRGPVASEFGDGRRAAGVPASRHVCLSATMVTDGNRSSSDSPERRGIAHASGFVPEPGRATRGCGRHLRESARERLARANVLVGERGHSRPAQSGLR